MSSSKAACPESHESLCPISRDWAEFFQCWSEEGSPTAASRKVRERELSYPAAFLSEAAQEIAPQLRERAVRLQGFGWEQFDWEQLGKCTKLITAARLQQSRKRVLGTSD